MYKGGCYKLCPCSFGLAVGLTCGLGMVIWSLWLMYFGVMPMMAQYQIPVPTFRELAILSLVGFFKGFVFGFFVALFYDWITSCCKKGGYCKVCKHECTGDQAEKCKDDAGTK